MRRRLKKQSEVRCSATVQIDGAKLVELKPDTGYVLQFKRPLAPGEGDYLMQVFTALSAQGLCGPVIIVPAGSDISELRNGYQAL